MTEQDLLDALEAARPRRDAGDRGLRMEEVAAATGWSVTKARTIMRQAVSAGAVGRGTRYQEGLDGKLYPVPVYYARKA